MVDRLLIDCLMRSCWALHEPVLCDLAGIIMRHAAAHRLTAIQITEIVERREHRSAARPSVTGARTRPAANSPASAQPGHVQLTAPGDHQYDVLQGVAIIPVRGVIAKRAEMVNGISQEQGTSCEAIGSMLLHAHEEPRIKAILLDVDSPGGSVAGVSDLADMIHAIAHGDVEGGGKRIVAQANDLAASAAYWLACQCNSLHVSRTGEVGSIGCFAIAHDTSRWFEEEAKTTVHVIKSRRHKGDFTPGAPVTDEMIAEAQRLVDAIDSIFIESVARGLGISAEQAGTLADGRVHIGTEAVGLGLADQVMSFDETLAQMVDEVSHIPAGGPRA